MPSRTTQAGVSPEFSAHTPCPAAPISSSRLQRAALASMISKPVRARRSPGGRQVLIILGVTAISWSAVFGGGNLLFG